MLTSQFLQRRQRRPQSFRLSAYSKPVRSAGLPGLIVSTASSEKLGHLSSATRPNSAYPWIPLSRLFAGMPCGEHAQSELAKPTFCDTHTSTGSKDNRTVRRSTPLIAVSAFSISCGGIARTARTESIEGARCGSPPRMSTATVQSSRVLVTPDFSLTSETFHLACHAIEPLITVCCIPSQGANCGETIDANRTACSRPIAGQACALFEVASDKGAYQGRDCCSDRGRRTIESVRRCAS